MADLKINGNTQITPIPLVLGTSSTTAKVGNTRIPRTCLVRVVASSGTVQVYSSQGIPAGTWMALTCNYIASGTGSGERIDFTKNANLTSFAGYGGSDATRYCCFINIQAQFASTISAATWVTIGTVNLNANGTQCYGGIGVEY